MSNTQQNELNMLYHELQAIIIRLEAVAGGIGDSKAKDQWHKKQEMLVASWNHTIEIIETNPLFGWVIDDDDYVGPDWQIFKEKVEWAMPEWSERDDLAMRGALIDEALHGHLGARVGEWIHPGNRDDVGVKLTPGEWESTEIAIVPMETLAEAKFVFETLISLYELTEALAEPLDPIH
jgi:hypothetical protein